MEEVNEIRDRVHERITKHTAFKVTQLVFLKFIIKVLVVDILGLM